MTVGLLAAAACFALAWLVIGTAREYVGVRCAACGRQMGPVPQHVRYCSHCWERAQDEPRIRAVIAGMDRRKKGKT